MPHICIAHARKKRRYAHHAFYELVSACLVNLPLYFAQFPRAALPFFWFTFFRSQKASDRILSLLWKTCEGHMRYKCVNTYRNSWLFLLVCSKLSFIFVKSHQQREKTERKKNLSRIRAGKKATRPERRQRKREREREEKIFIIRYINPNGRNSVSRFSSKTRSCLSFPFYLLLWITKSKVIWISWSGSLSLFLSLKVLTNHSLFTLNGTTAGEEEEETRSAAWKCGFISRGILRLWEGLASQPASQLRDREKRIDSSFFLLLPPFCGVKPGIDDKTMHHAC